LLEERKEIVLILPYYETPDMVRLILSGRLLRTGYGVENSYDDDKHFGYSGIDISKYEKEGSLVIVDSLKGLFGSELNIVNDNISSAMSLKAIIDRLDAHAKRRRKDGIAVLADIGSFYFYQSHDHHIQNLVEFEISLPQYAGKNVKLFCLYHQRDFEKRLRQEEQAKLLDNHNRNIMLVSPH